jgi:hypothetical protein
MPLDMHEVWHYVPSHCCWVLMWAPLWYKPDPPPPGAAKRNWGQW